MNMKREAAIQKALIHWLTTKSFTSPITWAANLNEYARHATNMGVDVGSPDLLIYQRRENITYFLFLELKSKTGKLSETQNVWNQRFDSYYVSDNCERAVAYGFSEAREIIEAWVRH